VYALRWENARTGRGGWVPAVRGGWRKGVPAADREYLPLTDEVITAHLSGELELGLYPLLDGDRCQWLAADFDGPAAMLDALAYLKAARTVGTSAALEVSRSGLGAHVWRWAAMTSSVRGRYSRPAAGTPLRQPPRTAGTQPSRPVPAFSHRSAYTSGLAANRLAKNATFAAGVEPACTGPGWPSKTPVCTGPGGRACRGVSSSSRTSRAFSARSRATSTRSADSSLSRPINGSVP